MKATIAPNIDVSGQARCEEVKPVKILRFDSNMDIEKVKQQLKEFTSSFNERFNKHEYIVNYTKDNKIDYIKKIDEE